MPSIDKKQKYLDSIPGAVPNALNLPKGCHFAPRCSKALPKCLEIKPKDRYYADGSMVSCHLYENGGDKDE